MSTPIHLAAAVLALLITSLSMRAQTFVNYHPSVTMGIGHGYDPRLGRSTVMIATNGPLSTNVNQGSLTFDAYYSQSKLDLAKSFSLNSSVSAKSASFSGKLGISYADSVAYSENTINFVLECNRDYGQTLLADVVPMPSFLSTVRLLGLTRRGEALHRAVTDFFGTHFISGYESIGKVVVIYSFHFASQATSRSFSSELSARYRGGVASVDLNVKAQELFSQTNSRVTMTYKFYSADSSAPIFTYPTNAITTYNDFLNLSAAVVNYCNTNMTVANAKQTKYYLTPLKYIGLDYFTLLDGYIPGDPLEADYDRFLTVYGQLQRWEDTLTGWTLEPGRMSWMNAAGQNLVTSMRRDVANYRKSLQVTAQRHFTNAEPLVVTDDIFNYAANFSRLPLPSISMIAPRDNSSGGRSYGIGIVDYGSKQLTVANAFQQIVGNPPNGVEGDAFDIYYDRTAFESYVLSRNPWASTIFSGPTWATIVARASTNHVGFFLAIDLAGSFFAGRDLLIHDSLGNVVDAVPGTTLGIRYAASSPLSSTNNDVALGVVSRSAQTLPDAISIQEYSVTNNGPGAAYGITATIPLPSNVVVMSATGSQGQGVFTNNSVVYEVGPLASGNAATIRLALSAIQTGEFTANLGVGEGLVNVGTNATVAPYELNVSAPSISHSRGTEYVELKWRSDTGRLAIDSNTDLRLTGWSRMTNSSNEGGLRTLRLPFGNTNGFFRLRAQ